jgi:hypothetical protein
MADPNWGSEIYSHYGYKWEGSERERPREKTLTGGGSEKR